MVGIADTVLGDAEDLVNLHDVLLFKALAYGEPLAARLEACGVMLGKVSDAIIADVVHGLSVRQFPMASKLQGRKAPLAKPEVMMAEAVALFPAKEELPLVDLRLLDMAKTLAAILGRIEAYVADRATAVDGLMAQEELVTNYLLSVAWADA